MSTGLKATRDEVRALDTRSLTEKISEEEIRITRMRFSHAVTPIENPSSIRILRRNIARMKTEQRKRSIGE
jgi:large subunit ribosomal protein L29